MGIEIREVTSKKDLKTFIRLPFKLYEDCPYWVPPLIMDELDCFNPQKNPAYEGAESKLFLAYKDDEPVGRIAGVNSWLANEKYKSKDIRFGWFDTINDYEVARALFQAVEQWGTQLGMETITGPQGFCDLDPAGIQIKGFDQLATIAYPYNYQYYPELVEQHGFKKDVDYLEFRSVNPLDEGIPERLLNLVDKLQKRSSLKILKFKKKKELLERSKELFELLDESFEELYGTVPLTQKQIDYYVKKYIGFVDKDMVKAALNENNEMVGFMITMPSLSKGFQKAKGKLLPFGWYHILKSTKEHEVIDFYLAGVKKQYRGSGVDLMMVMEIVKTAMAKGFKYSESNLELEDNKKVHAQWKYFNPTQHRSRRIYKKKI